MINRHPLQRNGFSLVELMTALAILILVCGVAFELLLVTMKKYHSGSQLLNTFQEARFGLDQMVRDINDSGYPPRNQIQASATPNPTGYAQTPIAWMPNYPSPACAIGTTCTTPSQWDLIIETDIDPWSKSSSNQVEWIRYKLDSGILYRSVNPKASGANPDVNAITAANLVPYVQNVVNDPSAAQLATLQAAYPTMFSSGPVPLFQYICESTPQPIDCTSTTPPPSTNDPQHVVAVVVTLIVQSPAADMQTGRPLVVQLKGEGRRLNPDY